MTGWFNAYADMWRRYAQFSGRTSVGGYWRVYAMNVLVQFAVLVIFVAAAVAEITAIAVAAYLVLVLYTLVGFVPVLAMTVRRLHDTDKSGATMLIVFIPVVGVIALLVFLMKSGTHHDNQYGPPPLGAQWTTRWFGPMTHYQAPAAAAAAAPAPAPAGQVPDEWSQYLDSVGQSRDAAGQYPEVSRPSAPPRTSPSARTAPSRPISQMPPTPPESTSS